MVATHHNCRSMHQYMIFGDECMPINMRTIPLLVASYWYLRYQEECISHCAIGPGLWHSVLVVDLHGPSCSSVIGPQVGPMKNRYSYNNRIGLIVSKHFYQHWTTCMIQGNQQSTYQYNFWVLVPCTT